MSAAAAIDFTNRAGRLMETRGTYDAGRSEEAPTSAAESATGNIRPLRTRGYTQTDNAYYDGLFGAISPTTHVCLMYIVRNTAGYHRDQVRLSYKQLGAILGMSRNTVMKGLQELERAHIIGSDGDERGRTQIHAYFLLPIEGWRLDSLHSHPQTSPKIELVENGNTSAKIGLDVSKIGLVEPQTSPKIGRLINKEKRKKVSKESGGAADASFVSASPDAVAAATASSSQQSSASVEQNPAQKKRRAIPAFAPESEPMQQAIRLRDGILRNYPKNKEANAARASVEKLVSWADAMEKLARLDHRTADEIRATIDFAINDSFWKQNVQSALSFREKFDKLDAKRLAIEAAKDRAHTAYPPKSRAAPAEPPQYASAKDYALWK